jgi:hypothetical protein
VDFRYYCLSDDDRIVFGSNFSAVDVTAAIAMAYESCETRGYPAHRIELWLGSRLVYRSKAPDP